MVRICDAHGFACNLKKATRVFRVSLLTQRELEGLLEELLKYANVFDYDDVTNLPRLVGAKHAIHLELG